VTAAADGDRQVVPAAEAHRGATSSVVVQRAMKRGGGFDGAVPMRRTVS
jgi:hypothetical protein